MKKNPEKAKERAKGCERMHPGWNQTGVAETTSYCACWLEKWGDFLAARASVSEKRPGSIDFHLLLHQKWERGATGWAYPLASHRRLSGIILLYWNLITQRIARRVRGPESDPVSQHYFLLELVSSVLYHWWETILLSSITGQVTEHFSSIH